MDEKLEHGKSENLGQKPREKVVEEQEFVLESVIGQFGWYQLRLVLLVWVVITFSGWGNAEYVFTTARSKTRCLVPECESMESSEWSTSWLEYALPMSGVAFDQCQRFAPIISNTSSNADSCSPQLFNQDVMIPCEEYVFETKNSVVYDFGLACQEWKRSSIGSLRTMGALIALPLGGFISDSWGRRVAICFGAINCAWLGTLRYFANTYIGFVVSEIIETIFATGAFTAGYILVTEQVGSKYRSVFGVSINTFFSVGQITAALIAWVFPYWRHLTLALYTPMFITLTFYFFLPESIRWLITRGRYTEAEELVKKIAKVNNRKNIDDSLKPLRLLSETQKSKETKQSEQTKPWLVETVFRNKPILYRCIVTPVWWITNTFTYYGLSVNAVNLSGNMYLNYMFVACVEIPGYWIAMYLVGIVGRKPVLVTAYWICAACQFGYILMPDGYEKLSLILYLVGKLSIACTTASTYLYTSELYPTEKRNSLMAFSSMIGRIGAILAPLTPALAATIWDKLPFVLFGSLAVTSGALVLTTPETLGVKLPDTMEEAANIGKNKI